MNMILMALAVVLVLLTAIFLAAVLRLTSRVAFVLAIYVFCYANIVLAGEIANSFRLLDRQWFFLLLHLILAAAAVFTWWRLGRPSLLGPFSGFRQELSRTRFARLFLEWPDLALLGSGLLLAFILAAVLNIAVPPNNNDSLSTHLSRVGYWLQHGSFFPWPTSRVYQVFYPVNSTLQFFWTVLFWGGDRLVGFVQWLAGLFSALAVFGLARLLRGSRPQAALAALVFLSFPIVLLQLTTTQNDLVITALFAAAVYFLLLGLQHRQKSPLLLSALCIGLGLGTKQTFYFLLPGLILLTLSTWRQLGRRIIPQLVIWSAGSVFFFILFAAYMNVINLVHWGNPFGTPERVGMLSGDLNIANTARSMVYNIPRYLYQAVDTSGLPRPLDGYAHKLKSHAVEFAFDRLGIEIEGTRYVFPGHVFRLADMNINQEEHAWFGLLSVLFLLPLLIQRSFQAVCRRLWIELGLLVNLLTIFLVFLFLFPYWNPYAGRYFLPVVAITTPLVAGFFRSDRLRHAISRGLIAGLALVVIAVTMLYNSAKPLVGKQARSQNIWISDRITLMALQNHGSLELFTMVARHIPTDAVLGLYTPEYVLDYPFFGEHFTRRLVPIYPFENLLDPSWLQEQGIQYILVQEFGSPLPVPPSGWQLIHQVDGWSLYLWGAD